MGSKLCGCLYHITAAIQVILAIIIVIVVAVKLDDTAITVEGSKVKVNSTCSLGTSLKSASLCIYVYVVVGISLAVSLVTSILQCCTCNLCGLGKILDLIVAIAGTAWWVIAAAIVQKNVSDAADLDLSLQNYRTATVAMMWVEVGLFSILVTAGFFRICGCAGGRDYEKA